jgi:hypothetical protein
MRVWSVAVALALGLASAASAQLPDAETLLRDLGFSADQIAQVKAGRFAPGTIRPSNERELVAALAFLVQTSPAELVKQMRADVLDRIDSNTIAFGLIEGGPSAASFAQLTIHPDAEERAQAYADAEPGGDLNLSAQELAAFDALGSAPTPDAVAGAVRNALVARLEAYRAQGLAGIAPYARSDGKTRSPADDLRSATTATKRLQELAPGAFQALLAYPAAKPAGLEETFDWSQYRAHGVPTIALTHTLLIPEGAAWVVAQRQFYVSGGYNCEQSIAAFLPMQQGTLVVYSNRTSTDQVTGFGGSAKRALGSKLLSSELETLYGKVQATEKAGGGR